MFKVERLRSLYGGPFARLAEIPSDRRVLSLLGDTIVKVLSKESRIDFTKRGWSGKDPKGGPPVWDSFSYEIRGQSTVDITTTFWGLFEMATGDIPARKMTWLTQDAKDAHPEKYIRTRTEKRLKMKRSGRVSVGQRMPLVVPIETASGQVIFRTAPFKTQDAWVHPGIAKFTFVQRAIKKSRDECARVIRDEVIRAFQENKP